jgi:hypothetical protein
MNEFFFGTVGQRLPSCTGFRVLACCTSGAILNYLSGGKKVGLGKEEGWYK